MVGNRKCCKCGRLNGKGKRELRPYGPGGKDVCAGCVFGEEDHQANKELLAEAERQFGKHLAAGDHVIDADAGIAVVTLKPKGDA